MPPTTPGLHHVTAIAGDPQANADFYVGTLGLRFVKRTVNHDDPQTYHFYFGDYEGTPGTNITFFPWTDRGRDGEFGAGQTRDTAYLIPPESVDYWVERLHEHGVGKTTESSSPAHQNTGCSEDADVEESERFGDTVLRFSDPDGIGLELVASAERSSAEHASGGEPRAASEDADNETVPWPDGPVPEEYQLRGFHSVTLAVREFGPTEEILTEVLGYERADEDGDRRRYRTPEGGPHSVVDLVETDAGRGTMGVGSVHHVALTAEDVDELEAYKEAYGERGLSANGPIDRKYFQSLYCREPGGVLFEIATDGPGFDADEDVSELGSSLVLPEWLEADREAIEAALPEFTPPAAADGGE